MRLNQTRKIFFVGINTGYVTDAEPDDRCRTFYAERSSPSLYCAIVGNVVIPNGQASNGVAATISRSSAWTSLALSISEAGTVPGIQLATAWDGYSGMKSFVSKDSAHAISEYKRVAASVDIPALRGLFEDLATGTAMAEDAGFKHVQLHAAHGYLFSLLVDPRFYPRADLAIELASKWTQATRSRGTEVSLRLSLRTGDEETDTRAHNDFLRKIFTVSADFYDLSSGFYNVDKRLIYPSRPEIIAERQRDSLQLARQHQSAQFIVSGRSLRADDADLPTNVHLGVCRDLVANAQFLADRTHGCRDTGKCHYHSRGAQHLTCGQWRSAV